MARGDLGAAREIFEGIDRHEKAQVVYQAACDVVDRVKNSLETEELRNCLENLSLASVQGRATSID